MKQLLQSMMGLPRWVQLWLPILFGTNTASLWFLDQTVGQYTALAFAFVFLVSQPMMLIQKGMTRMLAFPHVVWVPLVVYLAGQLWGAAPLAPGSVRTYALMVFTVNSISLGFDVVDAARWLGGRREVLGLHRT